MDQPASETRTEPAKPANAGFVWSGLVALSLFAFGYALTSLKPAPQLALVGVPLVGLLICSLAAERVQPKAFSVAGFFSTAAGLLISIPAWVATAGNWIAPEEHRSMPIGLLLAGGGLGLLLLNFVTRVVLIPAAASRRSRNLGLTLLSLTAVAAWAVDKVL